MVSKDRPTVSAVVITCNEEKNIRGCLESLRWVDEIILVDSGSKDRTVSIAREFTKHIFPRSWPGCFSAQRNFGIEQATGEWIVILDADERVTPESQTEIMGWLASSEAEEYVIVQVPRRNYFFGKWLRFGGVYPDVQWRLLKKGKVHYDEKSSDTAIFYGACKLFWEPFDHFTGEGIAERIRKTQRDAAYQAKERWDQNTRVHGYDFFVRPFAAFIKVYFLKQGFRDGFEGYLYSVLASFHTFVRYGKLWELMRG